MSFLDATGLGTFWAKLKNYFIPGSKFEGPVTELTDILTPINILPNAEFGQLELTEATQTIASATSGTQYGIGTQWIFQVFSGAASNVTITKARNSVRITGTLTSVPDSRCQVRIFNNASLTPNKFYTFTGHIKVHSTAISDYRIGVTFANNSGTSSYGTNPVYATETTGVGCFTDSDGTVGLGCAFRPPQDGIGAFDIEFSNMCLYEGEFKNPPINDGTDRYNQYVMINRYSPLGLLYKYRNLGSITGPKWIRLCKLRINSTDTNHYIKLIVSKSYTNSAPFVYSIEAMCMGTGTTLSSSITASQGIYAKGIASGSDSSTNKFTKFRFARDTDSNIYIEGYYANSKANSFYVNIELYCMGNSVTYDPYYSLRSFSPDGTNDTSVGTEYGYYLIRDMSTYIAP